MIDESIKKVYDNVMMELYESIGLLPDSYTIDYKKVEPSETVRFYLRCMINNNITMAIFDTQYIPESGNFIIKGGKYESTSEVDLGGLVCYIIRQILNL